MPLFIDESNQKWKIGMTEITVRNIECLIDNPDFRDWCKREGVAEKDILERWASEGATSRNEVLTARKIVLELESGGAPVSPDRKHAAWERLSRTIASRTSGHPILEPTVPHRNSYTGWWLTAAAAAIVIAAFLGFQYMETGFIKPAIIDNSVQPALVTVHTDYAESKVISLESGSQITLNANSSISYREGWVWGGEVHIDLKGEAYFDVSKRKSSDGPAFRVATADGSVRVLGTRFLVSTWSGRTHVVLEEGEVAIQKATGARTAADTILQPGERAEFSRYSPAVNIDHVNTEVYTSWLKGLWVFDHTPFIKVVERTEQMFGVEVAIADPALLVRKVSGSVESRNADTIIAALAKSLQVPFSREGNRFIIGEPVFETTFNNQSAN